MIHGVDIKQVLDSFDDKTAKTVGDALVKIKKDDDASKKGKDGVIRL